MIFPNIYFCVFYHTPKERMKKDFFLGRGGEWNGGQGKYFMFVYISFFFLKVLNYSYYIVKAHMYMQGVYINQLLATVYHKLTRIYAKTKQKRLYKYN